MLKKSQKEMYRWFFNKKESAVKLEEVKQIFEGKAIAGFRILLFGLGKSHNNGDFFPVEINSDLQNAFLRLLEHPEPPTHGFSVRTSAFVSTCQ